MYFRLRKSQLTAWWVAKKDAKLTFVNICSKKELTDDLVVMGFMKGHQLPEVCMSQNPVVKVTKKGVITAKGSFYPFEEAHALYIDFLMDVNEEDAVIAFNWEFDKGRMTADIKKDGEVIKDVTFDFKSYDDETNSFGYSEKLDSDVVVSAFSRRGVCMTLYIPMEIKQDMQCNAEFVYENERDACIKQVRKFINGG